MSKYKVLWFDDEWETLESVSEPALDYDIHLVGVSNAAEGIEMLRNDYSKFDAVLLDGKFFTDATKSGDEVGDKAFGDVIKYLSKERDHGKILPWFILSGQPSFVKENHSYVELYKEEAADWGGDIVYDKNDVDVDDKLFSAIKDAIETSDFFQIKQRYAEVFSLFDEEVLPKEESERVFELIKNLELKTPIKNTQDLFNPIRKVLETLKAELTNLAIIPADLNLNGLPFFLEGEVTMRYKDNKVYTNNNKVNALIVHILKGLIPVVQDACHVEGSLSLFVDRYIQSHERSYLYSASASQLLEVLVWFKFFVQENNNKEINKLRWEEKTSISARQIKGRVTRIADNGWGTFEDENFKEKLSIKPEMVSDSKLKEQDEIEVAAIPSPDGKKTFIKELKKL